jgi:hypothetical protein
MSETKSAFGCCHDVLKAAQVDAAKMAIFISDICTDSELKIVWHLQKCNLDVDLNNRSFPKINITIEVAGAKMKAREQ